MLRSITVPTNPLPILALPPGQILFPSLILRVQVRRKDGLALLKVNGPGSVIGCLPVRANKEGDKEDLKKTEGVGDEAGLKTDVTTLSEWGCVGRLVRVERLSDKTTLAVVEGLARINIRRFVQMHPFLQADVEVFADQGLSQSDVADLNSLKAAAVSVVAALNNLKLPPVLIRRLGHFVSTITLSQAGALADVLVATVLDDYETKLYFLSTPNAKERIQRGTELLKQQALMIKTSQKLTSSATSNMTPRQRELFLRQQMEAIRKELGERDDDEGVMTDGSSADETKDIEKRIESAQMPKEARDMAMKELSRMKRIPAQSAEHGVIRTYLDVLVSLPWGRYAKDSISTDREIVKKARKQLDHDHYGLDKVKKRLLEYLAVLRLKRQQFLEAQQTAEASSVKDNSVEAESKLSDEVAISEVDIKVETVDERQAALLQKYKDKGPILLLVGPPGVGKTSIANSLARSLQRPFHRISLGGVRDEAEIRGHRRTYVGAMPGLICQGLRKVGVSNPVFLLDEIDKISSNNFHGDPAAAMLEVLDPEQNNTFSDHYVNTPVDLSGVLFIATANTLDTIPAPLLDRMEVIQLPGYVWEEKLHIARNYLLPKQVAANALQKEHIEMNDEVLNKIATSYTREAGVRSLEREIASVCRSKAVQYAESRDQPDTIKYNPVVTLEELESILGIEKYEQEIADQTAKPGTSTGLAYMGSGNGGILHIEATSLPGKGSLTLTGKLGEVIRESARIALSWVMAHSYPLGIVSGRNDDPLEGRHIHIHAPSGSIPKDGPSAGTALCAALVSLLTNRTIDPHVAATGEITLRGLVLPVGGIKEKLIGADRAGVRKCVLPRRNRREVEAEIPQPIKDRMEVVYVDTVWEALDAIFETQITPTSHGQRALELARL